jgi:hypothetical protein
VRSLDLFVLSPKGVAFELTARAAVADFDQAPLRAILASFRLKG